MNFRDLMREALAADESETVPHDVMIKRMRDYRARHDAGCPFSPGDLVTPRKDSAVRDAGDPYLVLAVISDPRFHFESGELGSNTFGMRVDMRVASSTPDGCIAALWVESVDFEPYHAN